MTCDQFVFNDCKFSMHHCAFHMEWSLFYINRVIFVKCYQYITPRVKCTLGILFLDKISGEVILVDQ